MPNWEQNWKKKSLGTFARAESLCTSAVASLVKLLFPAIAVACRCIQMAEQQFKHPCWALAGVKLIVAAAVETHAAHARSAC